MTEFAVALAGFSGIAIALKARDGEFPGLDCFRTLQLLTWALSAAFVSTFPLVLASFGVSGMALWRVTSGAFLLILLLAAGQPVVLARSLSPVERAALSRVMWVLGVGGNFVLGLWQVLNIWRDSSPGPIFAGLIWLLFISYGSSSSRPCSSSGFS